MAPSLYQVGHVPSLGKGSVLLDRFVNGSPTGVFIHLGNCEQFEIEPKDDKAELVQALSPTPTLIAQAVKKRDLKIMIKGTDFSADHSQIYSLAGSPAGSLTVSATPITNEVLIAAAQTPNAKGRYFRTATPNIGTFTDLKQNAVALVVNTDYKVIDLVHGIIYIPTTSGIDVTGTEQITADYTPTAGTFAQVNGHTVNFVQGHILFVPNPADGPNITADVWRVNLTQDGKIGLISDEYNNWELSGTALDDTANHPNDPFYLYTYL
jgi:hypothetical protein